jgi:hypothetical protein
MSGFRIEPLASQDRKEFSCGSAQLDRYFRELVTQDIKRRVASCFVALDDGGPPASRGNAWASVWLPMPSCAQRARM